MIAPRVNSSIGIYCFDSRASSHYTFASLNHTLCERPLSRAVAFVVLQFEEVLQEEFCFCSLPRQLCNTRSFCNSDFCNIAYLTRLLCSHTQTLNWNICSRRALKFAKMMANAKRSPLTIHLETCCLHAHWNVCARCVALSVCFGTFLSFMSCFEVFE